jgi:putative oxidoreductase
MDTDKARDIGLLILRIGIGLMFAVVHGGPKLLGGPALWTKIGMSMEHLGIHFAPGLWGFLASAAECLGGMCLILGVGVRPAAVFMAFTMGVATAMHLGQGDGVKGASHAIELGVVFLALILLGGGRYSLSQLWAGRQAASRYHLPTES